MTHAVGSMRWALLGILVLGGALRLASAVASPPELIERDEFLPGAMTLSWSHHPIRIAQHGALPAYLIRLSSVVFGETLPGFRVLSVVAGVATILLLYLVAARWWGPVPGLVAGGLLAVERYHAAVSSRAVDLPFDLFFVMLAIFAFSNFLEASERSTGPAPGRWLYLAAAACAAGFLCKEFTALLLPALLLALVLAGQARWLRRSEPWIALLIFGLLILPDVYSSLTTTQADRLDLWNRQQQAAARLGTTITPEAYQQNGLFMSYGDQLSRFHGFGFNPEPLFFYVGDLLEWLGVPHDNGFSEFPYMHSVLGLVIWVAIVHNLARRRKDALTVLCLTLVGVLLLPFLLVQMGPPRGAFPTDPAMLWYWVDRTMLPALLLASRDLAGIVQKIVGRFVAA